MTDFRPLTRAEVPELLHLAHQIWHAHYPGIIRPTQIDYMLEQRYSLAAIEHSLDSTCWVAAHENSGMVGFAQGLADTPDAWKLDKLYVHPARQHRGIGRALVAHIADAARCAGATRLTLRVNRHNTLAIQAYRRYGFHLIGTDVLDIGNGYVMDDFLMSAEISKINQTVAGKIPVNVPHPSHTMKRHFTKMHGAGNDFVVLDGVTQQIELNAAQVRAIADRHFGVGCDQLLLVEKPTSPEADFRYRIFNADGGEVEQCGNGARCFVRFVVDKGLTKKQEITVETQSGLIKPRLEADGRVTVDMGAPRFEPGDIPFLADARALTYELDVEGSPVTISALSMGNPHAVQVVMDVDHAPVAIQGPRIENHPRFPQRVNAGFMQIVDRAHIRLRVFERGAGETLSCGTGACAAVAAGITRGLLDHRVDVQTRGGVLTIEWRGEGQPVTMTGPAQTVFEGILEL